MRLIKTSILATFIAGCVLSADASAVDFSFNGGESPTGFYGNNNEQSYDVAIRLDNPLLKGSKITSFSVALPATGIINTSVWLSTELKLKKVDGRGVNDPDICSIPATIVNDCLKVVFNTPCVIPPEGIYIGYSFTVDQLNDANSQHVSVVDCPDPSGFFLHTSRTKTRWGSMTEATGQSSAMTVGIEGNIKQLGMTVELPAIHTFIGENGKGRVSLLNTGVDAIESAQIVLQSEVFPELTVDMTCGHPVAFAHRLDDVCTFDLPPIDDAGEYPISCRVVKINGIGVNEGTCDATVSVYPFKPVARPLIDEYTGLWCGYCPKGYVVLEEMKQKYGDGFIACAYHYNDELAFNGKAPASPHDYPAAYVNRNATVKVENIPELWSSLCDFIPDADVNLSVEWTDASKTAVKAVTTLKFIKDSDNAGYRMNYVLIADNLSNNHWKQHNSYSGKDIDKYPYMDSELGRMFLDGDEFVTGLTFNDVALKAYDMTDSSSLLPAEIVAEQTYTHSYTFNFEGIEPDLLTHPDQLRVVGILTRGKSNTFVNCNSSAWINGEPFAPSSVQNTVVDIPRYEIGRYSIDGRKIGSNIPGLQIIRYSDGTASKIFVK